MVPKARATFRGDVGRIGGGGEGRKGVVVAVVMILVSAVGEM